MHSSPIVNVDLFVFHEIRQRYFLNMHICGGSAHYLEYYRLRNFDYRTPVDLGPDYDDLDRTDQKNRQLNALTNLRCRCANEDYYFGKEIADVGFSKDVKSLDRSRTGLVYNDVFGSYVSHDRNRSLKIEIGNFHKNRTHVASNSALRGSSAPSSLADLCKKMSGGETDESEYNSEDLDDEVPDSVCLEDLYEANLISSHDVLANTEPVYPLDDDLVFNERNVSRAVGNLFNGYYNDGIVTIKNSDFYDEYKKQLAAPNSMVWTGWTKSPMLRRFLTGHNCTFSFPISHTKDLFGIDLTDSRFVNLLVKQDHDSSGKLFDYIYFIFGRPPDVKSRNVCYVEDWESKYEKTRLFFLLVLRENRKIGYVDCRTRPMASSILLGLSNPLLFTSDQKDIYIDYYTGTDIYVYPYKGDYFIVADETAIYYDFTLLNDIQYELCYVYTKKLCVLLFSSADVARIGWVARDEKPEPKISKYCIDYCILGCVADVVPELRYVISRVCWYLQKKIGSFRDFYCKRELGYDPDVECRGGWEIKFEDCLPIWCKPDD